MVGSLRPLLRIALVSLSALAAACGGSGGDGAGGGGGGAGGPDAGGGGDGGGGGGGGGGEESCGAAGNDLIYVVDFQYNLLSFDPEQIGGNPFTLIGQLDCPAGPPWPVRGESVATPFSMSVDRNGTAWVLYTSGEIFHVSIEDASCTPTSFQKGQMGFEVFGMGFVSDSAGSNEETLHIAGGSAAQDQVGDLGFIDSAMTVTRIADLPNTEYGPELTGTGNGELYAYFPGSAQSSSIRRLNKMNGAVEESWTLAPLTGFARAWAFAHWGGKFYVFITEMDPFSGALTPQVKLFDPATGQETIAIPQSPYPVVGAGVSTCAPVVVD